MRGLVLILLFLPLLGCSGLAKPSAEDMLSVQREAASAYASQDYQRAAKLYGELAEQMPTDAETRYRQGNSLARLGDNNGAIDAYREALMRDPNFVKAWNNLLYVQLQAVGKTLNEMYAYIDPNDPEVAPIAKKVEAALRAFEVPVERQEH